MSIVEYKAWLKTASDMVVVDEIERWRYAYTNRMHDMKEAVEVERKNDMRYHLAWMDIYLGYVVAAQDELRERLK